MPVLSLVKTFAVFLLPHQEWVWAVGSNHSMGFTTQSEDQDGADTKTEANNWVLQVEADQPWETRGIGILIILVLIVVP